MFTYIFLCFALGSSVFGTIVYKRLMLNVQNGVKIGTIDVSQLDEASGLCASRKHPDILYSHNDHGGHNKVYAINATTAHVVSVLTINGAVNEDWEDIACGPCYGHMSDSCFYIGDIGDGGHPNAQTINRVQEPDSLSAQMTVNVDGTLKYSWGETDSCTLLLTPSAELYIISKVSGGHGLIAKIPSQGWSQSTPVLLASNTHLDGVTSTHGDPLGGDISPDGKEILIKVRDQVLHYTISAGSDIIQVLAGTPYGMPYIHEKKGEAVAFSAHGNSYYTLVEGSHKALYRYDART